jgi:hypothetical protein
MEINAVRRMTCRVDSPRGNPPQLRMAVIGVVPLARRLIESGSRPRGRDTFLCSAKEKYPKKGGPVAALILRSSLSPGRHTGLILPHR